MFQNRSISTGVAPQGSHRPARCARRRWSALGLAGLVLLLAGCGGGGGGGTQGDDQNPTPPTTPVPTTANNPPTNTGGGIQTAGSTTNVVLIGEPIAPGVISSGASWTNRSGFYPDIPPPAPPSSNQ
jgi:hypothetical protein